MNTFNLQELPAKAVVYSHLYCDGYALVMIVLNTVEADVSDSIFALVRMDSEGNLDVYDYTPISVYLDRSVEMSDERLIGDGLHSGYVEFEGTDTWRIHVLDATDLSGVKTLSETFHFDVFCGRSAE